MTENRAMLSYLPLPEIDDLNLSHSFKHNNCSRKSKKPPTIIPKSHNNSFNKSFSMSSVAQAISFKETSPSPLSSIYKPEETTSYFEQCFEVISVLGEGSFGKVFKVRSKEDGRLYAVKKSKQLYRSEKYRQERIEEVRRYEQLSENEHCITLYNAWEQDDCLYMQLELCQSSLDEYVAKIKFLSESMIWNILVDLLLALKALHDRNLIHLDIKLENILINYDNECKLGDFGLVVDLNRPDLHQSTEGDCRYIAPEIILQSKFSKSADIFSLGITILELASDLDLPKNGPLWQELRDGKLPLECLCLISEDLQKIIKATMHPNPNCRPDVNELLRSAKIQEILRKRNSFKRVKAFPKRIRHWISQQFSNLKLAIFWIFSLLIASLSLKSTKSKVVHGNNFDQQHHHHHHHHHHHLINPDTLHALPPLLRLDDSDFESSPTKQVEAAGKFFNSTPLSHNVGFRKKMRDYSNQELDDSNEHISVDLGKPTAENSISPNKSSLETRESISILRKKLFVNVDDSDG